MNTSPKMPNPKKLRYFELVKSPEFLEKTMVEQAKELEIDRTTLYEWVKEVDWTEVRDHIRQSYARYAPTVDLALIRKAQRGSEKAIELFFQRFEGWSVKQLSEIVSRREPIQDLTQEELEVKLVEALGKERLQTILGRLDGTQEQGEQPPKLAVHE